MKSLFECSFTLIVPDYNRATAEQIPQQSFLWAETASEVEAYYKEFIKRFDHDKDVVCSPNCSVMVIRTVNGELVQK